MRWVYIVDDSVLFAERLKEIVDALPEVAPLGWADNPRDAWMEIREWKPDVVLLDLQLHEKSGLELLKRIKGELPEIRVIITTGSLFPQHRNGSVEAGADGFVFKGGDMEQELAAALRRCAQSLKGHEKREHR